MANFLTLITNPSIKISPDIRFLRYRGHHFRLSMGPYGMVYVELLGAEKAPSKVFGVSGPAIPSLTTSNVSISEQLFHFLVSDFICFAVCYAAAAPAKTSGDVTSVSDVTPVSMTRHQGRYCSTGGSRGGQMGQKRLFAGQNNGFALPKTCCQYMVGIAKGGAKVHFCPS